VDKLHIILLGRRNTGKSSLMNALTGQQTAIVSATAGTTTDPVKRSYEIPGVASVVFTDTAGIDDTGALGAQRIRKTGEMIPQADIAFLVISGNRFDREEEELIETFGRYDLPFLILHNKSDEEPLRPELKRVLEERYRVPVLDFSAHSSSTAPLLEKVAQLRPATSPSSLLEGIAGAGSIVLLVTPIDSEAPVGRLILPQVQMLRNILDLHATGITLQPEEIRDFLEKTGITPDLVITDSQVFKMVSTRIPPHIPLTSFSILLARSKGYFEEYIRGTAFIDKLQDGDRILLLESCSHHSSCDDIGRNKIPALLRKYTGKNLEFEYIAGLDPIERAAQEYRLVIQCGGCMVTARQLKNRLTPFVKEGVPVSNYGMVIAYTNGIFTRSIELFRR
jgi:[FeFe] hydrogenase H-cluster maturation GTPase HydF